MIYSWLKCLDVMEPSDEYQQIRHSLRTWSSISLLIFNAKARLDKKCVKIRLRLCSMIAASYGIQRVSSQGQKLPEYPRRPLELLPDLHLF